MTRMHSQEAVMAANSSSSVATDKLDAILKAHVAVGEDTKDKVLGAAFVVVGRNGPIYQGAAGRIDLAPDSPAFSPTSFTWIASMTKIVTAVWIMRLVERGGRLSLDADVRGLVPRLGAMEILRGFDAADGRPVLEANTRPITLRQLLTHTVGLGYDIADPDLTRWSEAVGRKATNLDYTLDGWDTPLKFAPGEGWFYGSAVDWAAQAVLAALAGRAPDDDDHHAAAAAASAQPLLSASMAEEVFDPLSMRDSTFHPERFERARGRRVACSFRNAATGELTTGPCPVPTEPPVESGGAGLWSTAADHAALLQSLLVAATPPGRSREPVPHGRNSPGSLLKPETADEMLRPQLDGPQRAALKSITDAFRDAMVPEFPQGVQLDHGLGGIINLEDVPGKRRAGSMTWMGMANGHWWIDPTTGIAASLVVNVMPLPDPVVNRLYDELERVVYSDLLPR